MEYKQRQEERRKHIRHVPEEERTTKHPDGLREKGYRDVDWEALSSELSWWEDYLNDRSELEQFLFLSEMLETPFMGHLSDSLDWESVSILRDELTELLARLSLRLGMFPLFDFDFYLVEEFASHYSVAERYVYFKYLAKESKASKGDVEEDAGHREFFERCELEAEYLESIRPFHSVLSREESPFKITPERALPKSSLQPYHWQRSTRSLIYLINALFRAGYLSDADNRDRYELCAQHFLDKKGEPLTKKDLQAAEAQLIENSTKWNEGKPRDGATIDAIINSVSE